MKTKEQIEENIRYCRQQALEAHNEGNYDREISYGDQLAALYWVLMEDE